MPGNHQQDRNQQHQGADQARRNLERQKVQEQSNRSREKGESHHSDGRGKQGQRQQHDSGSSDAAGQDDVMNSDEEQLESASTDGMANEKGSLGSRVKGSSSNGSSGKSGKSR